MDGPGQIGVTFSSEGYQLLGTLFLASGAEPKPTAILLHGIPGIEKNYDLAHALRDAGWNSLIFHYRGCWGSRGSYRIATIPQDVSASINFLDRGTFAQVDRRRLFLIGHSLGGWAAVIAGANDPRILGVAVYGAVTDPTTFSFSRTMITDDFVPWLNGVDTSTIAEEWSDMGSDMNPVELVAGLSPRPILIIHSQADEVIPYSQSVQLHDYAKEPKLFIAHQDANHAFTWHRPWLRARILSWLALI